MSPENVEIVRRAYALLRYLSAFRRGERDDAFLEYFAPDGELVPPRNYPDIEPSYVGLEGSKRWLRQVDDVFDDWGIEAEQFLDADQQVVVLVRTSGTARESRAAVTIPVAHVCTLRDGRIVRLEVFLDRHKALEAAGLPEQAMSDSPNLELVRSLYAAWEHGDWSSTEWADPEIEYVIADGPSPGAWSGVAGMAEGFSNFLSTTEAFRVYADEYRELDSERVLVRVHHSGRGKTSGVELAQVRSGGVHLFHLRGGKVTRFVVYMDADRGLADLGLAPQA